MLPLPSGARWACLGNLGTMQEGRLIARASYPKGTVQVLRGPDGIMKLTGPSALTRTGTQNRGLLLEDPDFRQVAGLLDSPRAHLTCVAMTVPAAWGFLRAGVAIRHMKKHIFVKGVLITGNHEEAESLVRRLALFTARMAATHPKCPWRRMARHLMVHAEVSTVYVQWLIPASAFSDRCTMSEVMSWMNVMKSPLF